MFFGRRLTTGCRIRKWRKRCVQGIREGDELNIVVLTNDNFFSFTVLKEFLELRKEEIKLIVFSSALIGKRGAVASVIWSIRRTGFRHTVFKLLVYGVFGMMKVLCRLLPFIANEYSSCLWAERKGLASIEAPDVNNPKVVEQVRLANPDLIVSVSMNQIVRSELLKMPAKGCINVHCAPLPRYGGMSPYVWVLANNEDHSAATVHYMEEGLDEGDVVLQEKESVLKRDSAFCLFYRCCLRARQLLTKAVDGIEAGTATRHAQDLSRKTYFSWPTPDCVRALRRHGYSLATFTDFAKAILRRQPRLKAG
jgi:folate-dependent phosphoribosylglycinamide formyltransferase PurN